MGGDETIELEVFAMQDGQQRQELVEGSGVETQEILQVDGERCPVPQAQEDARDPPTPRCVARREIPKPFPVRKQFLLPFLLKGRRHGQKGSSSVRPGGDPSAPASGPNRCA